MIMVVQCENIADTTELTDTVCLVCPTRIQTANPKIRKQQHCILPLGYQSISLKDQIYTMYLFISRIVLHLFPGII